MATRNEGLAPMLRHYSASEIPEVMRELTVVRGSIAKVVAENSADDAMEILGVESDVYDALLDYVKPRWPELF